jgi:uncharacterized membrane protein YidH (DUF202 family)
VPSTRDPGSARERTALAWSRSELAIVAIAASVVKAGLDGGHPVAGIGGGATLVAIAAAVSIIGCSSSLRRETRLRLVALASAASAVIAFVLLLL